MGYAKVYMKGTTVVIVGTNPKRCQHEHLLGECGFKIITKFYSNGQPTPVDGFGWRGDKYFVINDRIAKMQRLMDGVDVPLMAIVAETRRNAGIKANQNRTKRIKLVVGAIVTKHKVPLFSCPECGKMLKVKIRSKWVKPGKEHVMLNSVETACCRVHYRFADITNEHGYLSTDLRRGVVDYTATLDLLPDDIKFKVELTK